MFDLKPRFDKIIIRGILNKDGNILLLKNSKNGKYMLPGSAMADYETVGQAFKKAIKKEIGLEKAKLGNFINMWSFMETENNTDYYFSILDFEFSTEENKIKLSDKYSESKWISEGEIDNEAMEEGQKKTLRKYFAWRSK
jgi:ADP-ribose pyrophosphatase YjhB (NUDIX family)